MGTSEQPASKISDWTFDIENANGNAGYGGCSEVPMEIKDRKLEI
jgi:hypothetical protein